MKLLAELFEGPIDIVGDVHGEHEALQRLLGKLGYDGAGRHPDGRRLVFVGDLTDRGPDSPAVLEQVAAMVAAGRAQCVAGNHELNLLRDVPKQGNDWWVRPQAVGRLPAQPIEPRAKQRLMAFLASLPVALARADLRVVHACWRAAAIAEISRRDDEGADVLGLYRSHANAFNERWRGAEMSAALAAEGAGVDLADDGQAPPFMPLHAQRDTEYQVSNPLSVLTSGEEAPTCTPFWAGGRWRMVERVKWWERYDDPVPVVVGHYWRRYSDTPSAFADKYGPDLFEGIEPHHWMGRRRNVYCVDFSVGGRAEQRYHDAPEHLCQLAALRVPEWLVVHDDGARWEVGAPG